MILAPVLGFFGTRPGKAVIGLAAVGFILVVAVQYGAQKERDAAKVEDLESFIETKEKFDAVQPSPDRDAAVERLRSNGLVR